jgi:hypothetical protein
VTSSRRFRFVQAEFPWVLGPEPGRYTLREHLGEGPRHILVLRTLGATERRLLARRRRRNAEPGPDPEPVLTSRVTLVDTHALDGGDAAERWLRSADLGALAAAGVARLNRVLHAQRIATADPYARGVALADALVVRVGYGAGEQVADGRWDRARELPREPAGRTLRHVRAALRPQERLAAVLGSRDAVLACEELALRARLDVDDERWREAALQLGVAFEAALAELEPWREVIGLSARLDELHARADDVRDAAAGALQGGLQERQIEVVTAVLGRLEAALRARTAGGL